MRFATVSPCEYISIHALHEESDEGFFGEDLRFVISIHALHEESDGLPCDARATRLRNFNPRSP